MSRTRFSILMALVLLIFFQSANSYTNTSNDDGAGFNNLAKRRGNHFEINGKPLYLNGFNAYWMMYFATDPCTRLKVTTTFQQASKYGMNVARIWGFNDGPGYRALQVSPGSYDENVFKGLDFVVSEAKKYGVFLILSFVNNFKDYGGRQQYVQWGKESGQSISNEDEFYTNLVVKQYYKNHVKAVMTRINSITGVVYKDDPTIFAWELMNEPRCPSDPTGKQLQEWIKEMATYVKSIDNKHLLEIGLEGFYGESIPQRKQYNPNNSPVGTDFITNNQIPQVDFATIHIYPEQWLPSTDSSEEAQLTFVETWIQAHSEDCNSLLKKPLVIGEFGRSFKLPGYTIEKRNSYYIKVYNAIYNCARNQGSCGGGLFWQLLSQGMSNFGDGYEVVLEDSPSTANIIAQQSHKLSSLK